MTAVWWSEVDTRIGTLGVASTERGLASVFLPRERAEHAARMRGLFGAHELRADDGRNGEAARQLGEYADGTRRSFTLPLDRRGGVFQWAVLDAVAEVPYGRTATYGGIAARIGRDGAGRAVGAANGANPLPIVVPCHRIVGSGGQLTGYGGGLPLKRVLLMLEGALPAESEAWQSWANRLGTGRPALRIGPRSTRIFCRPDCRYTARLVHPPAIFDRPEDALRDGFRACRVCSPLGAA